MIKERSPALVAEKPRSPESPAVSYLAGFVRNLDALTTEEFRAIHRFVQRRHDLDLPIQAYFAMRLGYPIARKLGIEAPIQAQLHYADLLEAIERKYVEERGILRSWDAVAGPDPP